MDTPAHRLAFGRQLRRLRRSAGWTSQEAFALHAGLDRTYVSGIERGRRNPTLDTIVKLAQALQIPPRALFGEYYDSLASPTSFIDSAGSQTGSQAAAAPPHQARTPPRSNAPSAQPRPDTLKRWAPRADRRSP
ncbi:MULTISPECIES: helix-turn-helix domain-containing protein [unclassified Pseudoclavibacter]|uniref:helix-turn-helix domain-containing protein n=1 Tax=unclassified Pseudoclavibacter TaxID=2615177 RepID=UPI001300CF3E|nr:helix-turn-helix transcriptional regulator [Pseudoclavibacter sp. CFCC 14310]KAB1662778.1 helix-turn-helix transcriptional regulator [Pseudoclavibacter sp. CFCC 13611]